MSDKGSEDVMTTTKTSAPFKAFMDRIGQKPSAVADGTGISYYSILRYQNGQRPSAGHRFAIRVYFERLLNRVIPESDIWGQQ